MNDMKLKPCPCCGSTDVKSDRGATPRGTNGHVECLEEDCWLIMYGKTEEHAIEMWNRRTDGEKGYEYTAFGMMSTEDQETLWQAEADGKMLQSWIGDKWCDLLYPCMGFSDIIYRVKPGENNGA